MKLAHPFFLFAAALSVTAAKASAPQVKTQAPGYYRLMVGNIEVTALFDGLFQMKAKEFFKNAPAGKIDELLAKSKEGDVVPTSVNAFLINTGSRLVLIDSGCGGFFGSDFGHILGNLKAAGYSPDQVDEVCVTHMHADHLGGIVADGKAVFPHAIIRMDQKDADYWLNVDNGKMAIPQLQVHFTNAVAAIAPYRATGQFKPFQGETEITAGVRAIPAYGHTPGHTAYAIEAQGKKLLLVGDLFHIEALEFPNPNFFFIGDSDSKRAVTERKKIFKDASEQGYLIGAAHLPFPGIGHVVAANSGYRYLPIHYAPVQ